METLYFSRSFTSVRRSFTSIQMCHTHTHPHPSWQGTVWLAADTGALDGCNACRFASAHCVRHCVGNM